MGLFGYRKASDLPETAPLFPLSGAILFPRGQLPLHIFEPRYLNMIDDALTEERVIGMVQPVAGAQNTALPELSEVGTLGRLTSFAETGDGRYLVTLTGVCRFRILREVPGRAPYRRAELDFKEFEADLKPPAPRARISRDLLRQALLRYTDVHGFSADWGAVDTAPAEALVNAVATLCPFDPLAKQALLEAENLTERCAALIALLEMDSDEHKDKGPLQ